MKDIIFATAVTAGVLFSGSQAGATELWDPHLRGVDEGLAAGAALPPGLYGVLNSWYAPFDQFDSNGSKTGLKVDVFVEAPILLWQSNFKILGGAYSAAIAEPFDYTNVKASNVAALSNNGHWGTFNTLIIPGQLAWALPNDFHIKAGLTINVNDASTSPATPPSTSGVGSGNGFWTVQPDLGISWMHDGWDLSANGHYAFNLKNPKTGYTSGQEIAIDYTATKTIGKWTVGLGGYSENQVTNDSGRGAAGCAAKGGCKVAIYGIGPMVEYDLGGALAMAEYNTPISARNDVAGPVFNFRLVKAF